MSLMWLCKNYQIITLLNIFIMYSAKVCTSTIHLPPYYHTSQIGKMAGNQIEKMLISCSNYGKSPEKYIIQIYQQLRSFSEIAYFIICKPLRLFAISLSKGGILNIIVIINHKIRYCLMQGHLDKHMQKDIKQIISMQTLLEEYDRQNKYLNQQVIQLLHQNSKLKMDKAKSNIINNMFKDTKATRSSKNIISKQIRKEVHQDEIVSKANTIKIQDDTNKNEMDKPLQCEYQGERMIKRNKSGKLIQRFRNDRDQMMLNSSSIKKDEAVQTITPEVTLTPIQKEVKETDKIFSFRLLPQQQQSKQISEKQINNSNVLQETAKMQIPCKQNESPQNRRLSSKNEDNIITIKRNKSIRHNSIKPSPQINQNSFKQCAYSYAQCSRIYRSNQKSSISSLQVMEKRKKFLEVITSHTPPKIVKVSDCC